jgi:hypothetical protein
MAPCCRPSLVSRRLLLVFGQLRTLNVIMGFDAFLHHGYMQRECLDRFIRQFVALLLLAQKRVHT